MNAGHMPAWLEWGVLIIAVGSGILFVSMMWPYIAHKEWKEKFYDNKVAWALIIVSVLAFIFIIAMGAWVDAFFPVETYK